MTNQPSRAEGLAIVISITGGEWASAILIQVNVAGWPPVGSIISIKGSHTSSSPRHGDEGKVWTIESSNEKDFYWGYGPVALSFSPVTNTIGQGTVITTEGGQGGYGTARLKKPNVTGWPPAGSIVNIYGYHSSDYPRNENIGSLWNLDSSDGQIFYWLDGPVAPALSPENYSKGQGTVISTGGGQGERAMITEQGSTDWAPVGSIIIITGKAPNGSMPTEIGITWPIIRNDTNGNYYWG